MQDDSANYAVVLHAGLADVKRRIAVPHKPACQLLSGQSLGLISSKTDGVIDRFRTVVSCEFCYLLFVLFVFCPVPIDFVAGSLRRCC